MQERLTVDGCLLIIFPENIYKDYFDLTLMDQRISTDAA